MTLLRISAICICTLVISTAAACSNGTTITAPPPSSGTDCKAVGSACTDTMGSVGCCGSNICLDGMCTPRKGLGSTCATNQECVYTQTVNGTTGSCGINTSPPKGDAGVSTGDAGVSTGKVCMWECDAKDKGTFTCDNGTNGGGNAAYMCDGTSYQLQGLCENCRPVRTPVPGSLDNTLFDAVACGTGKPIEIRYSLLGAPCEPEGAEDCSLDKTSLLYCKSGTWVVKNPCSGLMICGYYSPGINQCPSASSGCIGCR